MNKIQIKAISEVGKKAIHQHMLESNQVRGMKKMMLGRTGFSQQIISEDPLILEVSAKPGSMFSMVKPRHALFEIAESFEKNGAFEGYDYEVKVIE